MEIAKGKLYGVVTGDIVDSSKLDTPSRQQLFEAMKRGSAELRAWLGDEAMPLEVDIYGGDSWQMLLAAPGKTLAAGLFYRAFLKAFAPHCETRLAVAIDQIDFIPGSSVSEGDGQALRLSGTLLTEGLGKRQLGFAGQGTQAELWDMVFELIEAIATRWTDKQALAVTGALRGCTLEQIAGLWDPPIEQPTVNRQLMSARWRAVARAVEGFDRQFS